MPDSPREINLDALHEAILAAIRTKFPDFNEVADYNRIQQKIPVPAIYVMMTEANPAADPGTDQLLLSLRFEALVVYGFKAEKSKRSVRAAAVALALFIKGNRWNQYARPAQIEGIQADAFSPELDAYNVWRVDWTQEVYVGPSVWEGYDASNAAFADAEVTVRGNPVP